MLNNIGLPGLLLLSPMLIAVVMGVYSLAKVPNSDDKFYYAGFWLRLAAALIDGILMTLITLIPAITLGYWVGINMAGTSSAYEIEATAQALGNLLGFVVGWLYYTLLESSKYQATFGKKLLGLRVVDLDGNRIGFGKANGRYFGKLLSVFTLLIGHFMMGWTKRKQSLYDKMAGCLVVRNSSPSLSVAEASADKAVRKQPAFGGLALKPQVSEATRTPLKNLNIKNVGDLIKNYKGFSVYKQESGVSVDKQHFNNVIEAEKWIDCEFNRLNDEKKKREEALYLEQAVSNAETTGNEKADVFLLETLRLYKEGKLSVSTMLEIIESKKR